MKKALTKVLLVALMAILPLSFYAQKKQTKPVEKYFYIFAEGGLSVNHTDLANYGFVPFYQDLDGNGQKFVLNDGYVFKNFNGKLGLGYQFGKVMGVNAKFGTGTIGGEKLSYFGDWLIGIDAAAAADNAEAVKPFNAATLDKTTFMEANLNLTFNLTNLFFGYNPRRVFNFIPHVGIGGIRYHAGAVTCTAEADQGSNIAAKEDAEMTFTVPVGAELNFNLARKLDFFIDYTFTWAGNDRLDQVQKQPDDIQVINDMYSSVNAGLRFKFNNKQCDIEGMAERSNEIKITTNPKQLEAKDGQVCFDVVFEFPPEYFEDEAVMSITPTFTYEGGPIALEPVNFVGEKVNGGDFQVNYKTGHNNKTGEATFVKHYCEDYKEGMENAKLVGTPLFYVYKGQIYKNDQEIVNSAYFTEGGNRVITKNVIAPKMECAYEGLKYVSEGNTLVVTWMGSAMSFELYLNEDPEADDSKPVATVPGDVNKTKAYTHVIENLEPGDYHVYLKAVCDNGGIVINQGQSAGPATIAEQPKPIAVFYFDYESATLKPATAKNKIGVKEFFDVVAEKIAAGETINGFALEGWASPENGDGNNAKLSADRANAVESYIKGQMKKHKLNEKDFTFETIGGGSDWNKLTELLEESDMAEKNEILSALKRAGESESEIQRLKALYPGLEKEILPKIRRVEVFVK